MQNFFDYFADKRLFRKMELGDFEKFSFKNRPKGFIVNLRTEFNNNDWEVEVWFLNKEEYFKGMSEFKKIQEKINPKNRLLVLKEKMRREKRDLNKKKLSSFEIYKKVLGI